MRWILIIVFIVSALICPGTSFADSGCGVLPIFKIELPKIEVFLPVTNYCFSIKELIKESPIVPVYAWVEDVARLQAKVNRCI